MNNWWYAFFICTAICFFHIDAAIVIQGNSAGPQSFTFSLGPHARNPRGTSFYVGALKQGLAKEFAISRVLADEDQFTPFALQIATIDCQPEQTNPLFDAAITQLAVFGFRPVGLSGFVVANPMAVTEAEPSNIYFVDQQVNNNQACLLSARDIKDVTGTEITKGIIGLQRFENEAIFAAVKPHDSDIFGDPNSGIAVIALKQIQVNDQTQDRLIQIDAEPGPPPTPTATRAAALDRTSDVIKIDDDVVSIDNIIDMFYSFALQRLYIALQVQGGPQADDGAKAVVVGRLVNRKLLFSSIAPDAVFTDQDKIVGGTGANTEVSIHKVRTMRTTTGLDYLIVVGNNGDPASTQRSVFAMPLVNMRLTGSVDEQTQGTLADVNSNPEDFFTTQDDCSTLAELFIGRSFVVPATEPDEVFTNMNVEAFVGAGDLPSGDITDINVIDDVVFVSVGNPINNEKPGIFYSQALFDERGVIDAWTPWQRVAGTTDNVFGFSYESVLGNFLWMTGATQQSVRTVKRSQWGTGDEQGLADLVALLSELFPQACAGVQRLFDIPVNTPGLLDISLYIATGLQQVVLVESGQVNNGALCPNGGDFRSGLQRFSNGQITETFPVDTTRVISISCGALADIGAIIAAAIGVNDQTQNGYLFVGGACGLAVLAQENGDGWDTNIGLGKNFVGLVDGMRFIEIGDYCFVRKLLVDNGFLYVLTDTQLDRIDIADSDFATGQLSVVTVATLDNIRRGTDGTLLDLVVSDKLALLGASTGLFRVGDGANIQTANDNIEVNWTEVVIPEGIPVVRQLLPIASNNLPNGLAKTFIGNFYITDAYRGFDLAQENRYRVQEVETQPIDNDTVIPLPDMKVKDILTAFRFFGNFRNIVVFDGTDLLISRNRIATNPPFVLNREVPLPLNILNASTVTTILRSSASGSWLISGDFGLRVNE